MSRKRTLYPKVNKAVYECRDVLDECLQKAIENTGMTDPEKSALTTLHQDVIICTDVVPRYKEQR